MAEDTHLAIGDVLELLKTEFPDIKISKIRFLESQGLVNPERTPSGYRKFYRDDVMRLQWVLRQQRDHFLPLKVIRDRLESGVADFDEQGEPAAQPSLWDDAGTDSATAAHPGDPVVEAELVEVVRVTETVDVVVTRGIELADTADNVDDGPASPRPATRHDTETQPEPEPETERSTSNSDATLVTHGSSNTNDIGADATTNGADDPDPHDDRLSANDMATLQEGPDDRRRGRATTRDATMGARTGADMTETTPIATGSIEDLDAADGDIDSRLQRAEVCVEANIDDRTLAELERYGLVAADAEGTFDRRSVSIARLGGRFAAQGLEARHLRMFRMAAEREAGAYAQLVAPILRQRSPVARDGARERLAELEQLGAQMRQELVRELLEGI